MLKCLYVYHIWDKKNLTSNDDEMICFDIFYDKWCHITNTSLNSRWVLNCSELLFVLSQHVDIKKHIYKTIWCVMLFQAALLIITAQIIAEGSQKVPVVRKIYSGSFRLYSSLQCQIRTQQWRPPDKASAAQDVSPRGCVRHYNDSWEFLPQKIHINRYINIE